MSKLERISPESLAGNPRATISSWHKYCHIVEAAMANHPRPFVFRPTSSTPSTVVSRLRDAVRGFLAFDYPFTHDKAAVTRWYSEVIIKHDKEQIYIGPQTTITTVLQGNVPSASNELSFPTLSFEEVSAFCLLLSTGRLRGPIRVLHPPNTELIEHRPNLELVTQRDGSLLLV